MTWCKTPSKYVEIGMEYGVITFSWKIVKPIILRETPPASQEWRRWVKYGWPESRHVETEDWKERSPQPK